MMQFDMKQPTVSIVVPTYNRASLLPRALDSVVRQTFSDWEIVLVDDGSNDATAELAAEYERELGDKFNYSKQARTGCGGARNRGIDMARGRFVAFLDSDDEFVPHKLERQLELFDRHPELGMVFSDMAVFDSDGQADLNLFQAERDAFAALPVESMGQKCFLCLPKFFDHMLKQYLIPTIVATIRRETIGASIRWPADPSYSAEWLFFLRVARITQVAYVDEPLSIHHHVLGSATRTDRHRNNARLHGVLKAMSRSFTGLSRPQKQTIRDHLATVCSQLGYDCLRRGEHGLAARYFGESFRTKPSVRLMANTAEALCRCVLSRPRPATH